MPKAPTELILKLLIEEGELRSSLIGPDGHVLASGVAPFSEDELRKLVVADEYGRALTERVLGGQVGRALREAEPARVRLVIGGKPGMAYNVRWERLLRHTNGRLVPLSVGPDTPFSRLLYPDSLDHARPPRTEWPLRIVVAISNPSDLAAYKLTPLDVELELAEFERALEPLQGLVDFVHVEPPVSLDRVCQHLETEPSIFHFLGHGYFDVQTGKAALYLESEPERKTQHVSQDEWLLRMDALPRPPHLVVLAACESAARFNAGALVGMAPTLVKAGSGAVVAMQDKVGIEAAREFTFQFYRRLSQHGEIDLAANEARSFLLDRSDWSIPTVFLERGAERVFATPPETLEDDPARPGETLILIAEFKGHEEAFFEYELREELQAQVDKANLKRVRVVWLKNAALGPGDDDQARRLAARYGATLVVWGWYDRAGFRACFTVTEALFAYHDPTLLRPSTSVAERWQSPDGFAVFVNTKLPRQVDYFVFFTLAQLLYWEQDYERALTALTKSIDAAEGLAEPPVGLTYALFYRGNLNAVFRQDRPAAIADYRHALSLNPQFADAAFNLGGSLRILANTYSTNGDAAGAIDVYRQAVDAYRQAITIDPNYVRAYEGRGLAYWECWQLGRDKAAIEAAVENYDAALDRDPRAETYNRLALALRDLGQLDKALEQLNKAITFAPGTAHFYFNRGRLRNKLGDTVGTADDFQTFLRLSPQAENRDQILAWLEKHSQQTVA